MIKAAAKYLSQLKWYHCCCLIFPFIRILVIPNGEDIIPKFAQYGYTYQDAWYYVWSRLLEAILYFTVFRNNKIHLFLFAFIFSAIKIIDDKNTPFDFGISWPISLVVALIITVTYKNK